MNQKSAKTIIDIKVPVMPGGRSTTGKKQQKKRSNKGRKPRSRGRKNFPNSGASHEDYHFAASLLDPWGVQGARIPDTVTAPSWVAHSIYRNSATAVALPNGEHYIGRLFDITPGTTASGALNPISNLVVGNSAAYFQFARTANFNNQTGLNANGASFRAVSAGISIKYTGSPLNQTGTVLVGMVPRGVTLVPTGVDTLIQTLLNFPLTRTCNVVSNDMCTTVWVPPELAYNNYRASNDAQNLGQIFAVAYGLTSTATFEFTIAMNWEIQPNNAAFGIIPITNSICSFKAQEIAANVIATRSIFHTIREDVNTASSNGYDPVGGPATFTSFVVDRFFNSNLREEVLPRIAHGVNNALGVAQLVRNVGQGFSNVLGMLNSGNNAIGMATLGYAPGMT